ncbi:hypothetical protein SAMN02745163_03812 [Clostridium cavendishii DSM 21758]|uniref:Uncharacterized protein n=1 Tax=Clostridium cavendishii DSM 21758 TaxID=1121302 RepID=A0A1M6SHE5_9CLOT|nr:hypothetical protein [Clostridium cavendishii]SHK44171.1 hypothetical protein SAMN02745163_03812 [Clostridium cavendishii DSM 21758]
MSDQQYNFKDKANNKKKNFDRINQNSNEQVNEYQNDYNENDSFDYEQTNDDVDLIKKQDRPLKIFGIVCIIIFISASFFSNKSKVDTSQAAKKALKEKVSTSVSAGTVLLAKDEESQAKDYTIKHNSDSKETKIWVWDYADEDGDYVQVVVDGVPISESFMIKNKPKEFTVPSVGTVQVKGIKDGSGGISYAVKYGLNGTTYFNSTPENELNTYTLTR